MKRTLFELLRARPISNSANIESLEQKYGIILPSKYKLFAQTFYLGEKQIHREQYYNEKYKDYFDCSAYIYTFYGENIGFYDFNAIERCFEIWNSGGLSDRDYENKLFPVAGGDIGGGIYVGLEGKLRDKVVITDMVLPKELKEENNITIISDNIFEFVRGMEVLDLEDDFMYGTKHSQLYKNWGENFWRVKEE